MSKTGSTKNRILNLMTTGNKTLSEISEALSLAPSTVSQHLQELREMGAIKEVENEHIRKWKYYELNPEFDYSNSPLGNGIIASRIPTRRIFYYVIGIGLIIAVAYLLYSSTGGVSRGGTSQLSLNQQNYQYVPITLTDPPNVPNNTQSLVINYSSVAVHTSGKSQQSGWIYSNTSGTVDLMSLLNVSQVIAGIKLPSNSTIDMVRFNITSANITINDTTYNVTIPNGQITTQITGAGRINVTSGILVDLSPTVVAIYTDNSTVFVMVPTVKAVVIPSSGGSVHISSNVGNRTALTNNDIYYLDNAKANLSISGVSLSASNNSIGISINVTNNGNYNVTLNNLLVIGNQTPVILYNSSCGVIEPNQNPVPLWCRLINDQAIQIYGKHKVIVGTGDDRSMLYTTSALGVHVNSTLANITGTNQGAVNVTTKDDLYINSTQNVSAAGIMPNQNPYNYNTSSGHYDFGVGYNGIGSLTSGISPVDIRANSTEEANAILSASGNVTVTNYALLHLINPLPEQTNQSEAAIASTYKLLPILSYERGVLFAVQQNGNLTLGNKLYGVQLDARSYHYPGYVIKPGQSVTLTFHGQISLPGGFSVSLVPGAKYSIELTGQYGAYAVVNATAT